MEVIRLYPSGYCKGVINAIKIAKKTRINYPNDKIYVLGMIVHNDYVTKELAELNIITLDDKIKSKEELIDEIEEGIIIFTAHGIAQSIKDKVINKGLKYVDASCEDVIKNRDLIKDYLNNNYEVIYYGKKNHPESNAIISESNKIHLITNLDDIDKLDQFEKTIFTCQTTVSSYELKEIINKLINKYPNILIKNDICQATSSRQKAIMEVLDGELLYVVGDIKSNNTNMLKEIGKKYFPKVYLISNYQEIKLNDIEGIKKVHVTAGASTPPNLINEVVNYLKKQ